MKAPTPIIAFVFYTLALLAAITAGIALSANSGDNSQAAQTVQGFVLVGGIATVIVLLGCGQILRLIGNAAYYTEQTARAADAQMTQFTALLAVHHQQLALHKSEITLGGTQSTTLGDISSQLAYANSLLKWIGEQQQARDGGLKVVGSRDG